MDLNYFCPNDKDLMALFLDSLSVGDEIPYGLIGVRHGLLPVGNESRTNFDDLTERIYKPVRLKAQSLQKKIKRYFKKHKNQYLAIATKKGVLRILKGKEGSNKRMYNHEKGKSLIVESHRGLQQQVHKRNEGLTQKELYENEKFLLRNAELYRQTQLKGIIVAPPQPEKMIRLLPASKPKYAC
jgi:hypothetical protein